MNRSVSVGNPRSVIEIDPNVRVRGNETYAGFEDVTGLLEVGEEVTVRESEAGLLGEGRVTHIDLDRRLVYLSVDWASLSVATQEQLDTTRGDPHGISSVVDSYDLWQQALQMDTTSFLCKMVTSNEFFCPKTVNSGSGLTAVFRDEHSCPSQPGTLVGVR
jgi:hypothetical protein